MRLAHLARRRTELQNQLKLELTADFRSSIAAQSPPRLAVLGAFGRSGLIGRLVGGEYAGRQFVHPAVEQSATAGSAIAYS